MHWENARIVRDYRLQEREVYDHDLCVGVPFWSVTYVCPFAMLHDAPSEKQRAEHTAEVKGLITAGHGYGNSPTLLLQLDDEGHAIPAS